MEIRKIARRVIAVVGAIAVATPLAGSVENRPADLLTNGKFSFNVRARYEEVAQSGLLDAHALTLRSRVGFTTAEVAGWKAMLEAENISAVNGDDYNQSGLNPVAARRAVVPDPEITELNQFWLGYAAWKMAFTVGRQRLVLDNARFIGDLVWRQNLQTFDALVAQAKTWEQTTVTYAYVDRVRRPVGHRHPQGTFNSDSHLLNAARAGLPCGGTLTVYGYGLDFKNSVANSCATWGASYAGSAKLTDSAKLPFRIEAANQTDYGSSPLDYETGYLLGEVGVSGPPGGVTFGYEQLGSDHNVGFKTPLGTLHAFNGWADLFLTTPAAGLRNPYVKATAPLPQSIALTAFYHWFKTDATRVRLGEEFDAMLSRKFGRYVTAVAKYADFRRDSPLYPDVRKLWLQLEFVY